MAWDMCPVSRILQPPAKIRQVFCLKNKHDYVTNFNKAYNTLGLNYHRPSKQMKKRKIPRCDFTALVSPLTVLKNTLEKCEVNWKRGGLNWIVN